MGVNMQESKVTDTRIETAKALVQAKIAIESNPYKRKVYEIELKYIENCPEIYFREKSPEEVVKAYNNLFTPII